MSTSSKLAFIDNIYLTMGSATDGDYLLRYSASSTALELSTTNSDGSGTNAVVVDIQDGTDDVRVRGGFSTDNNTAPTTGIKVGGNVLSDTDSTDDLGTTSVRWANVYTDAVGDSGQTLGVKATTLSFDAASTIDTSGNNALTLDAGTAVLTLDGGTLESDATTLSFDAAATIDTSGNNALSLDAGTAVLTLDGGTLESDASTFSFDSAATIDTSGNNNLTLSAGTGTLVATAGDMTLFDDNNNADVSLSLGTSATEALVVQALNGGSNKTLEELRFTTKTASGTGDHGKMSFYVDEAEIATIDDGGIDLASGLSFTVAGSAIGGSVAADNITTGDGAVNIVTTSGNITLDAQANDADVIFIVDDGGSAVTALTLDGSDEGNAIFVNDVQLKSDSAVLEFGADLDTTLTHTDGTGLTLNSTNKLTFGDAASFVQQSADGTLRIDGEAIIDLNASTRVDVSGDLKVGGEVQTASIGYTDGDNAITIADGGGVTTAGTLAVTGAATITGDTIVGNGYGLVVGNSAQIVTDATPELQYLGTANDDTRAVWGRWSNDAVGSQLQFLKSRNTSIGSQTIVQDDDQLGRITSYADDGNDNAHHSTIISFEVDGTPSENDVPGRIVFSTTADGAPSSTERMRIASTGALTTSAAFSGFGYIMTQSHGSNPNGLSIHHSASANDDDSGHFLNCTDGTQRFQVFRNGDVTTSDDGILTSDSRLKTNIVNASNKLADLMRLKVRNFEWTPEYHPNQVGEKKIGFIAQEFEEVFPSLVTEYDIAGDNSVTEELYTAEDAALNQIPEGKDIGDVKVAAKAHEPMMRKSYKNALVPMLVKALQELTARVETLEAA
ncbi:hypothetical protein [uncultured Mediterranean phage uvDeep-CGR2-KM23-C246]|nr:hypothetical protein [uncultured Mediterranean phage uvDeep-CGR2-KM23-C246]